MMTDQDEAATITDLHNSLITNGCRHGDESLYYIHSVCHPGALLQVWYDRKTYLLHFECGACARDIVTLFAGVPGECQPVS